jgi:hypothetical protein
VIGDGFDNGKQVSRKTRKLDASLKHVSCAGRARRTETDRIELQRYRTDSRVKYFTHRGGIVHITSLFRLQRRYFSPFYTTFSCFSALRECIFFVILGETS